MVGERTVASVSATVGVARRATPVRIETPDPRSARASFAAASVAGSEAKPVPRELL